MLEKLLLHTSIMFYLLRALGFLQRMLEGCKRTAGIFKHQSQAEKRGDVKMNRAGGGRQGKSRKEEE